MRTRFLIRAVLLSGVAAVWSCTGAIDGQGGPGSNDTPGTMSGTDPGKPLPPIEVPNGGAGADGLPVRELAAGTALRRLTSDEYDNTLRDLLGEKTRNSILGLPPDVRSPFDNDYTKQAQSVALVEGVEILAKDAAGRLLADQARRDTAVTCARPIAAADADCMKRFLTGFGRRALRRPMTDPEIQRFLDKTMAVAKAEANFYAGVEIAVRAFLQHPEFLYRVEVGIPVPGVAGLHKLTGWEMASRLSYLLWGSMPSDALLDQAQAGMLSTPDQVRQVAAGMLDDKRARERMARFHALWLGYEGTSNGPDPLAQAMKIETDGLIDRVVFDKTKNLPWQDIFRSTESLVKYDLAQHYGLTKLPAGFTKVAPAKWVSYQGTARQGIFSHGAYLSVGAKFGDTSPTLRGKFIRERLFCQKIEPPPPELNVNVDDPPKNMQTMSPCKADRYSPMQQGGCKGCHSLMDLIGFGLEQYDATGKFRSVDIDATTKANLSQCPIAGDGEIVGVGTFNGPAGLATTLLKAGTFNACALTQLYRFAVGRTELDNGDQKAVDLYTGRTGGKDFRLGDLILDFVASEAFAHRREPAAMVK